MTLGRSKVGQEEETRMKAPGLLREGTLSRIDANAVQCEVEDYIVPWRI